MWHSKSNLPVQRFEGRVRILGHISRYTTTVLEEVQSDGSGLGDVAALRTFRVLRALKTVSVIPGMLLLCLQHIFMG